MARTGGSPFKPAAGPDPLAYLLGVYRGYIRFGMTDGLVVAVCFDLAPL